MNLAQHERAALADLLDELGPEAPTLCEGWATRDLAAHLVIRESRPDASLGLVVSPLSGWTQHVQDRAATGDYSALVQKVRLGPPTLSPFSLPGVDASANAFEYLVHHEDVRRAQPGWQPRVLPADAADDIWRRLTKAGKFVFRRSPTGVTLLRPEGPTTVVKSKDQMVTLVGDPVELVLQGFGRGEHAQVEIRGEEGAIETFNGGSFSV